MHISLRMLRHLSPFQPAFGAITHSLATRPCSVALGPRCSCNLAYLEAMPWSGWFLPAFKLTRASFCYRLSPAEIQQHVTSNTALSDLDFQVCFSLAFNYFSQLSIPAHSVFSSPWTFMSITSVTRSFVPLPPGIWVLPASVWKDLFCLCLVFLLCQLIFSRVHIICFGQIHSRFPSPASTLSPTNVTFFFIFKIH